MRTEHAKWNGHPVVKQLLNIKKTIPTSRVTRRVWEALDRICTAKGEEKIVHEQKKTMKVESCLYLNALQ